MTSLVDRRTVSVLFTILLVSGSLFLIYEARRPIVIVIFAVLFAYLLEPLVDWIQPRLRGSRGAAIAGTYLVLLAGVSLFLGIAGPRISQESTRLVKELGTLPENVEPGAIAQKLGSRQGWSDETLYRVQLFFSDHRDAITNYVRTLALEIPSLAGTILWALLIPILAIFVLLGKSEFVATLTAVMDSRHDRRFLRNVLNDLDQMLAAFIRAQLLLVLLSLLAYTTFLVAVGFPYAFPLAAIAGALEFIPVFGPLTGGLLLMGMAIGTGYKHYLLILIFLLVWRGIQDYLNSPLLMRRGVKLHPFAVIVGVLVCGELAGISGVFLSVPLIASLGIIWKNWRQREVAIDSNSPTPLHPAAPRPAP